MRIENPVQRYSAAVVAVMAAIATLALLYSGTTARAETVNRIVATLDGEPITSYEVQQFATDRAKLLPPSAAVSPSALLEVYITEKIIQKEINDQGIALRDEDVDRYIEGIRAQNQLTPERLEMALQAQGLTMEEYRQKVRDELLKAQLVNREIRGKVNVTPEDIERYYEAHKEEYRTPGEMHLRHILLRLAEDADATEVDAVMERARELRSRIEDGEDFTELAKEYSEDPAAESGGDLGFLTRGEMLDEFEKAAEKLDEGEVSQPVRTAAGVHLIELEEKKSSSHTAVADLADEIKERLYKAAVEERYERWLKEDLRLRHHVVIRP